jgi:DNA modification methylase
MRPPAPSSAPRRALFLGDNLDVLRRFVPDGTVDLVYLDPPFNTGRRHALHPRSAGRSGEAFADTWRWDRDAGKACADLLGDGALAPLVATLRAALGDSAVMAHLVMVAARLVELRRVLRPSGSLYLHCDPTTSHYLKVVLDRVMGDGNFRREIVWRSGWASGFKTATRNWVRNHDVLLYYVKDAGAAYAFNKEVAYRPHANGYRRRGGRANPMGVALDDVWDDPALYSPGIKSFSREKLGYPTQKPLALLQRIIAVSSRPGDVVLDPFCGSGTCPAAAEKLGRGWIAIDSSRRAIDVTCRRFRDDIGMVLRPISVRASGGTRRRPGCGPARAGPGSPATW